VSFVIQIHIEVQKSIRHKKNLAFNVVWSEHNFFV